MDLFFFSTIPGLSVVKKKKERDGAQIVPGDHDSIPNQNVSNGLFLEQETWDLLSPYFFLMNKRLMPLTKAS